MKKWWLLIFVLLNLSIVNGYQILGDGYAPNLIGDGIMGFYDGYFTWLNFFIYLLFFFSVVKMSFGDREYSAPAVFALGLGLAMSLVFWENRTGNNLIRDFSWVIIFGFLLYLFIATLKFVRGHIIGKGGFMGWSSSIIVTIAFYYLLLFLTKMVTGANFLVLMFENMFSNFNISSEIFGMPTWWVLGSVVVILAVFLIVLIVRRGGRENREGEEHGRPERSGRQGRRESTPDNGNGQAIDEAQRREVRMRTTLALRVLHSLQNSNLMRARTRHGSLVDFEAFNNHMATILFSDAAGTRSIRNILNHESINIIAGQDMLRVIASWHTNLNLISNEVHSRLSATPPTVPTRSQYRTYYRELRNFFNMIESFIENIRRRG
jgi:hypothetical protein